MTPQKLFHARDCHLAWRGKFIARIQIICSIVCIALPLYKMGTVKGVPRPKCRILRIQPCLLICQPFSLFRRGVLPSAEGFMMNQHRLIDLYMKVAGLVQPKTERHIIVRHCKGLVKTARRVKHAFSDQHTRRRDRQHIIVYRVMPMIQAACVRHAAKLVRRSDAHVRNPGMLDSVLCLLTLYR